MTIQSLDSFGKGGVAPIDFSDVTKTYTPDQAANEEALQEIAGREVDKDYEAARENSALQQAEQEKEDLLHTTEDLLTQGMVTPTQAVSYLEGYTPEITPEDTKYSLELEASGAALSKSIADNIHVAVNGGVDGYTPAEDLAKSEYVNTALVNARAKLASRGDGFLKTVADTVESAVAPQYVLNSLMARGLTNKWESVESTEELSQLMRKHLAEAANTMSLRDFTNYADAWFEEIGNITNSVDAMTILDYYEGGGDTWTDYSGYLEIIGGGAKFLGRIGKGFKLYKAAGDVKGVANATRTAFKEGDKATVLSEGIMKTATKPVEDVTDISYASKVSPVISEEVLKLEQGIYNDKELKQISKATKDLFEENSMDVVDVTTREELDGRLISDVVIGNDAGNAMTKKQAEKFANRLGLDNYNLVKKNNEGYYITTQHEVINPNIDVDPRDWEVAPDTRVGRFISGPLGSLKRTFLGVAGISEDASTKAIVAERKYLGILNNIADEYQSSYAKLPKPQRKQLDLIYEEGQQGKGKWFTEAELKDKGLNDAQIKAYNGFHKVSDFEKNVAEFNKRKMRTREGYKQYEVTKSTWLGKKSFVGKEESIKANVNNKQIIVRDVNGKLVEDLSKYKEDGYTLIKLDRQAINNTSVDVSHVLLPKNGTKVGRITQPLIMYQPGGRRYYQQGTHFIKIGSGMINPKTMNKVKGFVKTVTTADNYKDAVRTAEEINKVLDIAKRYDIEDAIGIQKELDALNNRFFKVDDYDTFKDLIKTDKNPKGILDTDYRAQALTESAPYEWADGTFESALDADDAYSDLIMNRQHYIRQRGNLLDSVNGNSARLMSFSDVYDRTIQRAARVGAYGEMMQWYDKELVKYKDFITNWNAIKDLSTIKKFELAETSLPARISASHEQLRKMRALESLIGHGKRIMEAQTPVDKQINHIMGSVSSMLEAASPKMMRAPMTPALAKLADANPLKFMKAIVYRSSMYFFNCAQFINQGMGVITTLSAGSLSKLTAPRVINGWLPLRLSLAFSDHKKISDGLFKAATKMMAMDEEGAHKLKLLLRNLGGNVIAGTQPGATREYGRTFAQGKKSFATIIDNILMFPPNEINGMNSIMSSMVAVLENPKADLTTLMRKSSALNLNMTRAHNSAWQAGKTIIPGTDMFAQWSSYPIRLMETVADKNLTKAQKTKIWLSTLLLTGGVGNTLLSREGAVNANKWMLENGVPQGAADVVTKGTLGAILTDMEIAFDGGAHLWDQVQPWVDLAETVAGDEDAFNMLENIPASDAFNKVFGTTKAVLDYIVPSESHIDFVHWAAVASKDPTIMTGLRNWVRAVTAWKVGKYYNSAGDEVAVGLDEADAVHILFGLKPIESEDIFRASTILGDQQEAVEKALAAVKPITNKVLTYRLSNAESAEGDENYNRLMDIRASVIVETRQMLRDNYGPGADKAFIHGLFKDFNKNREKYSRTMEQASRNLSEEDLKNTIGRFK